MALVFDRDRLSNVEEKVLLREAFGLPPPSAKEFAEAHLKDQATERQPSALPPTPLPPSAKEFAEAHLKDQATEHQPPALPLTPTPAPAVAAGEMQGHGRANSDARDHLASACTSAFDMVEFWPVLQPQSRRLSRLQQVLWRGATRQRRPWPRRGSPPRT